MKAISQISKIAIFLILLIGGFIRLHDLGDASFVNNELYIMLHFRMLDEGFWPFLNSFFEWEIHPPLNHFLMYIWGKLVGFDEFSQRLLSSLLGTSSIYLVYRAGRRAFGIYAGLLSSIFLCFNFASISLSRMATSYGWQIFFSSLSFFLLVELLHTKKSTRKKSILWIGYIFVGVAMCYIHYYLMGLVFFQLITLLILVDFKTDRKLIGFATAVIGLCFLPWIPVVIRQYPRVKTHDYPRVLGDSPFLDYLFYLSNESLFIALMFAGGLVLGLLQLYSKNKETREEDWRMSVFFAASSIVPLITIYLISKLFTPMWNLHYLVLLIPPQILFISKVFANTSNKFFLNFAVSSFLLFTSISYLNGNYQTNYLVRVDIRQAVDFVISQEPKVATEMRKPITVLNYGWSQYLFDYYFKRANIENVNYLVESGRLNVLDSRSGIEQMDRRLRMGEIERIWLLKTYNSLSQPLKQYLEKNFEVLKQGNFHKASAVLLKRRARK